MSAVREFVADLREDYQEQWLKALLVVIVTIVYLAALGTVLVVGLWMLLA